MYIMINISLKSIRFLNINTFEDNMTLNTLQQKQINNTKISVYLLYTVKHFVINKL